MKNRFLYCILAFLMLPNVSATAQVRLMETVHDGKTLVMFTPQYLMINQLRIEIDRRLADRHWIVFAPHYIQNFQQYQRHSGLGLSVMYRFFLENSSSYIGFGPQITQHTFNNYAKDNFTQSDLWLYRTNIAQYGFNAIVGSYFRLHPHLFGDIYGGLGYRFSKSVSTDGLDHSFSNGYFSHAHTGLMVMLGIRIGIML